MTFWSNSRSTVRIGRVEFEIATQPQSALTMWAAGVVDGNLVFTSNQECSSCSSCKPCEGVQKCNMSGQYSIALCQDFHNIPIFLYFGASQVGLLVEFLKNWVPFLLKNHFLYPWSKEVWNWMGHEIWTRLNRHSPVMAFKDTVRLKALEKNRKS